MHRKRGKIRDLFGTQKKKKISKEENKATKLARRRCLGRFPYTLALHTHHTNR